MQAKAKRYDCLIVPCTEHYTNQAYLEFGSVDNKLGGNKIYHCKQCGAIMDRDLNAAKNILLKYMIEHTTERVRLTPCLRWMKCLTLCSLDITYEECRNCFFESQLSLIWRKMKTVAKMCFSLDPKLPCVTNVLRHWKNRNPIMIENTDFLHFIIQSKYFLLIWLANYPVTAYKITFPITTSHFLQTLKCPQAFLCKLY